MRQRLSSTFSYVSLPSSPTHPPPPPRRGKTKTGIFWPGLTYLTPISVSTCLSLTTCRTLLWRIVVVHRCEGYADNLHSCMYLLSRVVENRDKEKRKKGKKKKQPSISHFINTSVSLGVYWNNENCTSMVKPYYHEYFQHEWNWLKT